MRLKLLLWSFVLASPMVFAAKITSLKVDGSIVTFTENTAKTAAVPACAAANPTKWGLSLTTDADRATYSVLVAAMASNMEVLVESAQKCVNGTSLDQVKSVEVIPAPIAAVTPQGFRIVAVGNTSSNGGSVIKTLKAANGKPYMTSQGQGRDSYITCNELSVPYKDLCLIN
ncbi:hypothetical protein A5320_20275 [Rheinheimera sp. SA_1]|uniref:hypothetical protein n=1 Tax=Rheinheimera sp. SA_1 TaxID=1827365 RepID=UPI0008016681|nr:hypothetical protein [Rheinheimera sp. SA_1]OBP13177.1 hypothetical protein A5320_20275 [Rheinheimera sp. SA_1]